MMATWFQRVSDEFVCLTPEGCARGVDTLHFLGSIADLGRCRSWVNDPIARGT